MKMLKGNIILIVVLAMFSVVTLWGCAGNLPESKRVDYLEQNWGKSFESAKKNQILNPEAGKSLEPVIGLDGQVAEHGVNKYKKSFEKEVEVKTTTTFEIGGSESN
ncbi:MAG: hypothetical protein JRC89_09860 [Deltaproteobacteria bacterium]|nr:hypothetical protein [Deltaproteobacteria bacterium]